MKKARRIKDTREFQAILQNKRFKHSSSFTIYYRETKENVSRFGISVPKKMGKAVLRNKAKRQVRSMLREIGIDTLAYDGIIMVRQGYFKKSYADNQKDLEKLLKTVKI